MIINIFLSNKKHKYKKHIDKKRRYIYILYCKKFAVKVYTLNCDSIIIISSKSVTRTLNIALFILRANYRLFERERAREKVPLCYAFILSKFSLTEYLLNTNCTANFVFLRVSLYIPP